MHHQWSVCQAVKLNLIVVATLTTTWQHFIFYCHIWCYVLQVQMTHSNVSVWANVQEIWVRDSVCKLAFGFFPWRWSTKKLAEHSKCDRPLKESNEHTWTCTQRPKTPLLGLNRPGNKLSNPPPPHKKAYKHAWLWNSCIALSLCAACLHMHRLCLTDTKCTFLWHWQQCYSFNHTLQTGCHRTVWRLAEKWENASDTVSHFLWNL